MQSCVELLVAICVAAIAGGLMCAEADQGRNYMFQSSYHGGFHSSFQCMSWRHDWEIGI